MHNNTMVCLEDGLRAIDKAWLHFAEPSNIAEIGEFIIKCVRSRKACGHDYSSAWRAISTLEISGCYEVAAELKREIGWPL